MTVTSELNVITAATIDVTIDGATTVLDEFNRPVTFPDRITESKTYNVTAGQIRVSLRRNGLELATIDGKPLYLNMPRDNTLTISPVAVGNSGDLDVGDLNVTGTLSAPRTIVEGNIEIQATDGGNIGIHGEAGVGINSSDGPIQIVPATSLSLYDGEGLDTDDRPALETATNEATVVAQFNLLRTVLIALGVATDGD